MGAFRVVQAVGAAAIVPTSLGLILTTIAPARRQHAVRIWTLLGSVGAAAGPVLGGLLVTLSWRWIFVINVPLGVTAAIAATSFVPDVRHHSTIKLPDVVGGALLILSIGALALGLVQGSEWGWGSAGTLGSFAVAIVGALLFVARSLSAASPIVDFRLFKDRASARANLPIFLVNLGFGLQLLGLILLMQEAWGWSALQTGLAIAPGPVMVSIAALVIRPRLPKRLPDRLVAVIGILLQAGAGLLLGASIGRQAYYFGAVLPGWMLIGAGVGFWLPTVITAGSQNLAPHQSATGSAVLQMGRWIGSTIGVALLVVVLGSSGGAGATIDQFKNVWWWAALPAVVGAITALTIPHRSSVGPSPAPSAETTDVELAAH
jgi:Major Facilitator Superfamily